MDKLLLQLFCFLNLIVIHYATEYGDEISGNREAYNLTALFMKNLSHGQRFPNFNEDDFRSITKLNINSTEFYTKFMSLREESLEISKCFGDILFTLQHLKSEWALRMLDSFGKPESGILEGNIRWVGDYNECIQTHSSNRNSTVGNFNGKYCSVSWVLPLNSSIPVSIVNGICVPDSCSPTELKNALILLYKTGRYPVLNDGFTSILNSSIICKPTERHLTTPAKAVIALLSILFTLVVLGSCITSLKYFKKLMKESKPESLIVNISERGHFIGDDSRIDNDRSDCESDDVPMLQGTEFSSKINGCLDKLGAFLSCFCLFTNGSKLLNTDSSDTQLLCIHGIRFLSMSWIILGHVYAFGSAETRNIREGVELIDNFPFQIVLQGFYAVDSFFVLSGFLLAYLTMKVLYKTEDQNKTISWLYFYIHRFVRLTPMYMIILGFYATVYFYIGSGPFWPDGDFDPTCRDNWWYNLLYINNFVNITDQCMAWSWYLANDMQFFVISPLFLITLWRWPKLGYFLVATFLCASWISSFVITYHYELMASISELLTNPSMNDLAQAMPKFFLYFNKLYVKPYTRIGPYLIGMLLGYSLIKFQRSNKQKYSWFILLSGWIVASSITLASIYGLYHNHPTLLASSFYNALCRTCFALGLSWVIYVCLTGHGGFVNSILSYKLFIPLSRLTYAAYLIHPIITSFYYGSLKQNFEFSHPTVVIIYLGIMLVTYGLSLPISLMLEYPVAALEKLVIKTFTRNEVL